MSRSIVDSPTGVTILGAGDVDPAVLKLALQHAPLLVAADGGAARALDFGYEPEAVIGDIDSLDSGTSSRLPPGKVHRISEQETTDFDKCIRSVAAPFLLAVGFTGARLDHELAAFWTLAAHSSRKCVLIGPEDVAFIAPERMAIDLLPGTRVSFFAMGDVVGEAEGLRWPIAGLDFRPGSGRLGVSNEATGPVTLRFTAEKMLTFLPLAALGPLIAALRPGSAAP